MVVRSGEDSKGSVVRLQVHQVANDRNLRGGRLEADRMVPAPPVLMPPQRRAVRVLDTQVPGDPSQILRGDHSTQRLRAAIRREHTLDDAVPPPKEHQRVVRPHTRRVATLGQELFDVGTQSGHLAILEEPLQESEPLSAEGERIDASITDHEAILTLALVVGITNEASAHLTS